MHDFWITYVVSVGLLVKEIKQYFDCGWQIVGREYSSEQFIYEVL